MRKHTYTTTAATTTTDDLSSCMAGGHVRKHRHAVKNPGTHTQAWDRAQSMKDTCARRGTTRAHGTRSADWGHAR